MKIHPTAIVHPEAKLYEDIEIGPYTIIENDVLIGKGTKIGYHVVIKKHTTIGQDCIIHPGAIIGEIPQIKGYEEKESYVIIGNNNIIREYVTIHRGWKEKESTIIGDNNFIMANVHIAHNCEIGSNVILANFATLGGHVKVEDKAFISALVAIHQFVKIGTLSMVSGLSKIVKDVPPYMLVSDQPAVVYGLNSIGLRRANLSQETRNRLKDAYKILYRSDLNISQAIERIKESQFGSLTEIDHLIRFIRNSQRGICPAKKHKNNAEEIETSLPEDD